MPNLDPLTIEACAKLACEMNYAAGWEIAHALRALATAPAQDTTTVPREMLAEMNRHIEALETIGPSRSASLLDAQIERAKLIDKLAAAPKEAWHRIYAASRGRKERGVSQPAPVNDYIEALRSWTADEFVIMSQEYREARAECNSPMDSCGWCQHMFEDGERMAPARRAMSESMMLCQSCVANVRT